MTLKARKNRLIKPTIEKNTTQKEELTLLEPEDKEREDEALECIEGTLNSDE